jgi:methyl-accepting chemotaxis protein
MEPGENDVFLKDARDLAATDIRNPVALVRDLQRFTSDHHKVAFATLQLIETGQQFEGGHDPTACNLGRWMASFQTTNPELKRCLAEIKSQHDSFHQGIAEVKGLVAAGNKEEARKHVQSEMKECMDKTFQAFAAMSAEAQKASDLYERMQKQAMSALRLKQQVARDLLNQIITVANNSATDSDLKAQAE